MFAREAIFDDDERFYAKLLDNDVTLPVNKLIAVVLVAAFVVIRARFEAILSVVFGCPLALQN